MTEKRTETYWYNEKGVLTRKQVQTETDINTYWYPAESPTYTAPTLPWADPRSGIVISPRDTVTINKTEHISAL